MIRKTARFVLTILLLAGLFSFGYGQSKKPEKPRLVVLVIVEQMRYEYLERFSPHYSNEGFKKIMSYGTQCVDAHVNFSYPSTASSFASISTGTTPSQHGIIGNQWYNKNNGSQIHATADKNYPNIGSQPHAEYAVSATNLIGSTFGEELTTQTFGRSRSYTISLDPTAAVLCAGHNANGVFWLDEYTGEWTSSTYYNKVLPAWFYAFNKKGLAKLYINRTWNTFLPIEKYKESANDNSKYEIGFRNQSTFPYNLQKFKDSYKPYKILKTTPFGNTYIKDFAIELIEQERLGKSANNTDFLTIAYTATEEIGNRFGCLSKEVEDTYIRLDFELTFLLNYLETHIGKDNFLLILTSNHGMSFSPKSDQQKATKTGIFKPNETMYLLDKHLDVTFGEADWIEHYQDLQIYLDKKAIKKYNRTIAEVEDDCATFLLSLNSVQSAVGATWLSSHNFCSNETFRLVDNAYHGGRSGNVFITLKPGWCEQSVESVGTHMSPYNFDTHVPLIWYGWKMEPKIMRQPIEITDIIVTLCDLTKTAKPNMATGKVIENLIR